MASNYDITMRQFNGIDYDTLYPKTKLSQIGDLANYAQINSSGLYLPNGAKSGGILDMNGNKITNVANPVNDNDAVNKSYVDLKDYKLVATSLISSRSIPITDEFYEAIAGIVVLRAPFSFNVSKDRYIGLEIVNKYTIYDYLIRLTGEVNTTFTKDLYVPFTINSYFDGTDNTYNFYIIGNESKELTGPNYCSVGDSIRLKNLITSFVTQDNNMELWLKKMT